MQVYTLDHDATQTFSERLSSVRLEHTETLAISAELLDAMVETGRLRALPERVTSRVPPALLPILTLADAGTPVCVIESVAGRAGQPWAAVIAAACGARIVDVEEALLVAVIDETGRTVSGRPQSAVGPVIEPGRRRIAISCRSIVVDHPAAPSRSMKFTIDAAHRLPIFVSIDGLSSSARAVLLAALEDEVLLSDVWFITTGGVVLGVPHSSRVRLQARGCQ